MLTLGAISLIEMAHRFAVARLGRPGHERSCAFRFDATRPLAWLVAAALMVGGLLAVPPHLAVVASAWSEATIAARGEGTRL